MLTPGFEPDASLTLDWYDIYIRNAIGRLDPNLILQDCYQSQNLSSPFCADVGPRTGVASGAPGQLTTITDTEGNLGGIKTDGLDLVLHYDLPLSRLGIPGDNHLGFDNAGTWTFSYEEQTGVNSPYSQFAGTLDLPTSATNPGLIAHYRDNAVIDLRHESVDVAWTVLYTGAGQAVVVQGPSQDFPGNKVGAMVYHDLAATWRHGTTTLTFGIKNVFDKDPPFWNDGTVNTNEYTYDTVGRYFYLNLKADLGKSLSSSP